MATRCKKCGGIIPDIMLGDIKGNRGDCKNHIPILPDIKYNQVV